MADLSDMEAVAFLESERLKAAAAAAAEPEIPEVPMNDYVHYVNHNGIIEKAVIVSARGNIATLMIQGAHKNDKYKKDNVRFSVEKEKCTYHYQDDRKAIG